MVENCLSGYNSCMFAYGQVHAHFINFVGFIYLQRRIWIWVLFIYMLIFWPRQTGSGKTYTMMGGIYEVEGKLDEDCGLTLRIFEHLFTRIGMVWQLNSFFF